MGRKKSQSDYPSIDAIDAAFENDVQRNNDYLSGLLSEQDAPEVTSGHRNRNSDNYQAFDEGNPSEFGASDYEGGYGGGY